MPPISTLASGLSLLPLPEENTEKETEKEESAKPTPFTIQEDLGILKCIRVYYGSSFPFDRKVPWNFWNVYRKTTGSWRSNSSLYHHWIGSICKKYSMFLERGHLNECIEFVEAEIRVRQGEKLVPRIHQATPLEAARSQTQRTVTRTDGQVPQPLYRNMSMPVQGVTWPCMYRPQ